MANGKDTRFKPGVSGNSKGRPKLPKEIKELRNRTRSDVETLILKFYNKTEYELDLIVRDSKTTMMEKHVARIMAKGIAKGDHVSFGFLSDYVFGKKPEKVDMDLKSSDGSMKSSQVVIMLPPEDG